MRALAARHGMPQDARRTLDEEVGEMLHFLHSLSAVLWYDAPGLRELIVLEPRWVLDAVTSFARNFSLHDRRELLQIILEELQSLIPRYRALADNGQVELCMSPYAHPIVPLLLDMNSAREAMPDVHLPVTTDYPGGEARARWHLDKGLETFERVFQRKPTGLWPSEGGVSQLLDQSL